MRDFRLRAGFGGQDGEPGPPWGKKENVQGRHRRRESAMLVFLFLRCMLTMDWNAAMF
jgi:hypothetical protein